MSVALLPSSALAPASDWAELVLLPSSAQAQAPARLCWFYSQLLRPAGRPAVRPADQNSTLQSELDFPVKSKVVRINGKTLEIS